MLYPLSYGGKSLIFRPIYEVVVADRTQSERKSRSRALTSRCSTSRQADGRKKFGASPTNSKELKVPEEKSGSCSSRSDTHSRPSQWGDLRYAASRQSREIPNRSAD